MSKPYLRTYNTDHISKTMKKRNLNDRSLSALTKELDPEGKGVVVMTVRRARLGSIVNLNSLFLICYALEITPESTFIKAKEGSEGK